ncbi:RNA methyltransferase [Desulfococcaceae bacterium HSG9]|nr:RNA methyltransferase [Desulfococcaceae bacterium HSG9]
MPTHLPDKPAFAKVNLDNITIVLHKPRVPENIGAAARAICNMGIPRLIVVSPSHFDLIKVMKLATHAAAKIVEGIENYATLKEALAPFHYVVGSTARLGGQRQIISSPSTLAQRLISLSQNNRIAIVFGPEDRGLTNAELRYCQDLVNIPTAGFASLNLAQAVLVICYEILQARIDALTDKTATFTPRMAQRHELDGMYDQLRTVLSKISFINSENPDYQMGKLRQFFTRLELRAKDVQIIRGLCRQVLWYGKKCYEDGHRKA